MQILTTLLLLIGLFIMWITRYREERAEEQRKVIRHKREPKAISETNEDDDFNEDLTKRHLKGTLEEKREVEARPPNSLEKIDNLSIYKRGVIWKEILDLPVSER